MMIVGIIHTISLDGIRPKKLRCYKGGCITKFPKSNTASIHHIALARFYQL